jgi:mannose-6-phosphate isomerase-like protein (cupin superfamily)
MSATIGKVATTTSTTRSQVAGPHMHHEHTDAYYVLEGELPLIGREAETSAVGAGGFLAAPPRSPSSAEKPRSAMPAQVRAT